MISKNLSVFAFALFALVIASGIGSSLPCATSSSTFVEICITNTIPSSVTPGTSIPVNFTVEYTGTAMNDPVDFSLSSATGGSWTGFPTNVLINASQMLPFSASLTIPSTASIGSAVNATLSAKVGTAPTNLASVSLPLINVVQPSITFSVPSILYVGKNNTITLQNNGNAALSSVALSTVSTSATFGLQFNPLTIPTIAPNGGVAAVTITTTNSDALKFGRYTADIKARDDSHNIQSITQIAIAKSFCKSGPVGGNLSITKLDLTGSGDDDEDWKLFDTVEVEVKVDNDGNDDVDDVIIELGLFDSTGKSFVGELDFISDDEEMDIGDLGDGNDETVTFEFRVPASMDTGSYRLAVKAYSDGAEAKECIDNSDEFDNGFYHAVSVDEEDNEERFVIVDDIRLPTEAVCGESLSGSFGVFNIGEDDQDQVKVILENRELGLSREFEIRDNLDKGEDKVLDFSFTVPQVQDGTYNLQFKTEYDYRSGAYHEQSEDTFTAPLKVIGCTPNVVGGGISIIPSLDSEAKAGEKLVVTAEIKNEGSETRSFTLSALDYQSWATLDDIDPETFELDAGETKQVTLTLSVKEDATGPESFTLQANSGSQIETQEVEVNIAAGTSGLPSFLSGGNSQILWIVGIINVVLIILIIVVAVRLARK